ncbi:MAG: Rha family transcriptional regulator [Candidatus Competibacter denitrificans]
MSTQLISLALIEGEPRVDSRLIAVELGVAHKNTRSLVENYQNEFQEFGQLPFKTEVVNGHQGGGNPTKFYLLNEDQTYFLMTLVRNTEEAVNLKKRLVQAFAQYRSATPQPKALPAHPETITIPTGEYIDLLKAHIQHLQLASQPKRQGLSTEEKTRIKKLRAAGLSYATIGKQIGRAEGTIVTYMRRIRLLQEA